MHIRFTTRLALLRDDYYQGLSSQMAGKAAFMKFIVAQLGARMHYAVPRMLHAAGMLERFYTDICAVKGFPWFLRLLPSNAMPHELKRLRARVPQGVPTDRITAFSLLGLAYAYRRMRSKTPTETTSTHLWAGQTFCNKILQRGFGEATCVYTFNSAGLELLKAAKTLGLRTVMEQTIAPTRIQRKLLNEERERFPDWELPHVEDAFFTNFVHREEAEWQQADLILGGSEFVKEGIMAVGGPADRCVVVPYGVDSRFKHPYKEPHGGPLRILTVGTVGLRKGAPYILEAAKKLKDKAVFRMVGGIQVSKKARRMLAEHVELTGLVPRSEIFSHYAWADVFLLPSICEGSATVTYEALAAGLPVICTSYTGSVVRHGVDGFIVSFRDVDTILDALNKILERPRLLRDMAEAAKERAASFDIENYQRRLVRALQELETGALLKRG